jgi:asparagine synthase (glutamine-hydrolysing)
MFAFHNNPEPMCGIAGFSGGFDPAILSMMSEAVTHRGPDASGTAILEAGNGNRVGFAHRRLSILDLSAEANQPMIARCAHCSADGYGSLVLIYNGEIYNFRELRELLRAKGHSFRTASDSEVLLHLYAEYGLDMLSKLNGIFAFAIYDGRPRGRASGIEQGDVILARDQIGVKPLYYAVLPEGLLFASELKALIRCPTLSRTIDVTALHQQLAYLWVPAPRTMLQGVRKLRPGQAMVIRDGRISREWCYYDIPYGDTRFTDSEGVIVEELRTKVETAVQRQLISDVPIGAFLSGGLDSSSVVAMMKRARPRENPICYTISFVDYGGSDLSNADIGFARRVAAHVGLDLRAIEIDASIIKHLDRMLYALDEPQADPAPINALLIAERARADGIKVLLSGAGGDDIFSGYRRHAALQTERYWGRFPRPIRRLMANTARRSAAGRGLNPRTPWRRRLVKLFENADLPPEQRMVSYFWWSGESLRRGLYSEQLSGQLDAEETAAPLLETLSRIPNEKNRLNRMLYLETKHFLADHNLNYTDKMGMAAGVEVRVPLLDLELVEFASRIPPELKQKGATGKYILKRAMEPYLPRDVIYREKVGFGAPLRHWLRSDLRHVVDDTLSTQSIANRGLFNPIAVQRLIELDRVGKIDGAYLIFAIMSLELWCRMFVDRSR